MNKDSLKKCLDRLQDLSTLEGNWDGYGSLPMSPVAIKMASKFLDASRAFCKSYHIFPTVHGGIAYEFINSGWDYSIEFTPKGEASIWGVEISGEQKELEEIIFEDLNEAFYIEFNSRVK
jgi:hypothetical protein